MNHCKDCNKIIDIRSIRCGKCNGKIHSINSSGKNASGFIDGHTLEQHYCEICNKKITCNAKKCQSCFGIKHGLYSKINTQYNKCLDCDKIISPQAKRCRSCAQTERNRTNPPISNPKIRFCEDCNKQLSKTAYYLETIRCNSCEVKRRYKKGLKLPPKFKRFKYNKNINMRSSWEVKYAKYLDKNNIKWQYESKRFNLGKSTYIPDFYLPETNEYIEIKGWFRIKDKKKMKDFKLKYPKEQITILQQQDLIELGVL